MTKIGTTSQASLLLVGILTTFALGLVAASSAAEHDAGTQPLKPFSIDASKLEEFLARANEGKFDHHPDDEKHDRARPMHVEQYEHLMKEVRDAIPDEVHQHVNEPHRKGMDPPQAHSRKLQSAADIRLVMSYDLSATTTDKANHIQNVVMPKVADVIKGMVKVNAPVSGNLFLPRQCNAFWPSTGECATVRPVGTCGSLAAHNAQYFGSYKLCPNQPSTNGGTCTTYDTSQTGVANADMVLYVTASQASCSGTTLAYAGYCLLDPTTGRPLAGFVNWCPNMVDVADFEDELDTGVHEVLHAMVFSSSLFTYFRQPGTNNQVSALTDVADVSGSTPTAIKTANVVAKAREHFNCNSLTKVLIENGGGSGTAGSHWEMSWMQDEVMVGSSGSARASWYDEARATTHTQTSKLLERQELPKDAQDRDAQGVVHQNSLGPPRFSFLLDSSVVVENHHGTHPR